MERHFRRLATPLLFALVTTGALADDIEIYTGPGDVPGCVAGDIDALGATLLAPAVLLDGSDPLAHADTLYFTVFRPGAGALWPGNVKNYRIVGGADGGEGPIIVDARGADAIDPATGLIRDTATSLWTPPRLAPDGGDPRRGGLASRLFDHDGDESPIAASRERSVFTYTATAGAGGTITDLTDPANALHEDNAHLPDVNEHGRITRTMLGRPGMAADAFIERLRWARGVDVTDHDDDGDADEGRALIGASLHAAPLIVPYGGGGDALFLASSDGFVHAARLEGPEGRRLAGWSWMPPDQLARIDRMFADRPTGGFDHGLDGPLDAWIADGGVDGDSAGASAPGRVTLYLGQRRGGRHYHALDVTDFDRPAFLWSIVGGPALPRLGQTWSRPRHTVIADYRHGATAPTPRHVLIVGGGYDTRQDDYGARAPDSVGNAVFMLDALTGEVLWWAGGTRGAGDTAPDLALADMNYSIPGDIRLIDVDGDGVTDRFYAADTGGQLWRFDIAPRPGNLAGRITGGRIADLQRPSAHAGPPPEADNRRFYHPPDVALVTPPGGAPYHALAIGSGYRAHPADTEVDDRIYVVNDHDIDGPPRDAAGDVVYHTRFEGDLLDVSAGIVEDALSVEERKRLAAGWFIELADPGEKVLGPALTVAGELLVTSYVPADSDDATAGSPCAPRLGRSRVYALDILDGSPVANLAGETSSIGSGSSSAPAALTAEDRSMDLAARGIAPPPTVVFTDNPERPVTIMVGTEPVAPLGYDNDPEATYWLQREVY